MENINQVKTYTNPIKHYEFKGKNVDMIALESERKGYQSLQWATFKQWCTIGRIPNKGSTGLRLTVFSQGADEGKPNRFSKQSYFNYEQTVELSKKDGE